MNYIHLTKKTGFRILQKNLPIKLLKILFVKESEQDICFIRTFVRFIEDYDSSDLLDFTSGISLIQLFSLKYRNSAAMAV